MRLARLCALPLALCSAACSERAGDTPLASGPPPVHGSDKRIKDVTDPARSDHADYLQSSPAISGAVVIAVDTYDETRNGKSMGTVYVQDIGSQDPYSGISLFAPAFGPGTPRISSGDVLDLRGDYQETTKIGATVVFAPGAVLPQIAQPISVFRFETSVPAPVLLDEKGRSGGGWAEVLRNFDQARPWLGMLVRITGVTLHGSGAAATSGRVSIPLHENSGNSGGGRCQDPFPKPASVVNDLFPLENLNLQEGQTVKSITGVLSFFCSVRIAPRSAADIEL